MNGSLHTIVTNISKHAYREKKIGYRKDFLPLKWRIISPSATQERERTAHSINLVWLTIHVEFVHVFRLANLKIFYVVNKESQRRNSHKECTLKWTLHTPKTAFLEEE